MRARILVVFLLWMLVACSQKPNVLPSPAPPATVTRPVSKGVVQVTTIPAGDVKPTARAYLDAWKNDDYASMYALLTSVSKDAIDEMEFAKHYSSVATEAALSGVDCEILSSLVINPEVAQVSYRVTLHSSLVGDIQRDTLMNLTREKGQWRVQWDDSLILPELKGGNYLGMDRTKASRANIYDSSGRALVAQTDATAIGLYPDQIKPDQTGALLAEASRLTGLRTDTIQAMIDHVQPGADWYLPLAEVSADKVANRLDVLSGFGGALVFKSYKSRYYFDGGVAPHLVGYVSAIQPEEVQAYQRKGYTQDERVGRSGLEKWGEEYLAGKRGGSLYVFNPQGQPVTKLAEAASQPSEAIYTTIDKDFQLSVQEALAGFKGAAVVLENSTGRVLAIASSPGYDPNAFEPVNFNSYSTLTSLNQDDGRPLFNRATQGQYPLGSVFKIITMAAALESGAFAADSSYECGYFFEELPGVKLNDWTYDYFQRDGKTIPSGLLTLPQGLIRSCNPWFWHIGLGLFNQGLTRAVSDMARGFGLGSPTGIAGVDEASGQVPDPNSPMDATNLAIGQGDLQVTPLQVADFIAAVGNGGTLYTPQVIEHIAPPDGAPTYSFTVKTRGSLPVKPATLQTIQQAMIGVVSSSKPRGTAYHVFTGLDIPVAGKTGTATSGSDLPHAWFGGYTYANRKDKPDIAIVVVIENIGEGSDYAAPIFRRIVEMYFRGSPGKLYPWESTYYVTRTPTTEGESTATPAEQNAPQATPKKRR